MLKRGGFVRREAWLGKRRRSGDYSIVDKKITTKGKHITKLNVAFRQSRKLEVRYIISAESQTDVQVYIMAANTCGSVNYFTYIL